MKAIKVIGIGCLAIVCILVVVGAGLWKMVSRFFSNVEFTTGPPSKAQSIPDGYAVEGDKVYYTRNSNLFGNWMPSRTTLEGVDAKTFQALADGYHGKDAKHVFYEGILVSDANATSFKSLESGYAGDAARMYFQGKAIQGSKPLDTTSFVLLNGSGQRAKDKNHVYASGLVVEGADPATFELLHGTVVGRDKSDYYSVTFVDNASIMHPLHVDMASFKLTITMEPPVPGENPWDNLWERIWASDHQRYYVGGKGFAIADPATFQVLQYGYAKDSKHVYFLDHVLAEADPATFQIVSPDHEKLYVNWSWSFARYGKDAHHVFYHDTILTAADPATFTVENERVFKDKNGRYQQGVLRNDF